MEARTEYMVAGPPVAACGVVSVSMVILRLVCGKDKKMVCQIAAQDGGKNAPRAGAWARRGGHGMAGEAAGGPSAGARFCAAKGSSSGLRQRPAQRVTDKIATAGA